MQETTELIKFRNGNKSWSLSVVQLPDTGYSEFFSRWCWTFTLIGCRQKTLELINTGPLHSLPRVAGGQSRQVSWATNSSLRMRSPQSSVLSFGLRLFFLYFPLPNKEVPSFEALRKSWCCALPNSSARFLLQMNPWKAGSLLRDHQAFCLAELLSREGQDGAPAPAVPSAAIKTLASKEEKCKTALSVLQTSGRSLQTLASCFWWLCRVNAAGRAGG